MKYFLLILFLCIGIRVATASTICNLPFTVTVSSGGVVSGKAPQQYINLGYGFTWHFDDSVTYSGPTFQRTFSTPGLYHIYLWVITPYYGGCNSGDSVLIDNCHIYHNTVDSESTYELLRAVSLAPRDSFYWDFGDGTTATGDTIYKSWGSTGNYSVKARRYLGGSAIDSFSTVINYQQPIYRLTSTVLPGGQIHYQLPVNLSLTDKRIAWSSPSGTGNGTEFTSTTTSPGPVITHLLVTDTLTQAVIWQTSDTVNYPSAFIWYEQLSPYSRTIHLHGESLLASDSLTWNTSDGSHFTGDSIWHLFPDSGTWQVNLSVWHAGSAIATSSMDVHLSTPAKCGFTYAPLDNGMMKLRANKSSLPSGYAAVWFTNDGNPYQIGDSIYVFYPSPGWYPMTLKIVYTQNGDTISAVNDSVFYPDCVILVTKNSSFPGNYTFVANSLNNHDSYNWDFGDGTNGTGDTIIHAYADTGSYNITATEVLGGSNTCVAHYTLIDKNTLDQCTFSYTRVGDMLYRFDPPANAESLGYHFSWNTCAGIRTEAHPIVQFPLSCEGLSSADLLIWDSTATDSTVICQPSQIIDIGRCRIIALQDNSIDGLWHFNAQLLAQNHTVHWDFGDGQTGSGDTLTHQYAHQGNFVVVMTEDSSGIPYCTSTQTIYNYREHHICAFGSSILQPASAPFTVNLDALILPSPDSVIWSFSPYVASVSGEQTTVTLPSDSVYQIIGRSYINNEVCIDTLTVQPVDPLKFFTQHVAVDPNYPFVAQYTATNVLQCVYPAWQFGDDEYAYDSIGRHNYQSPGTYYATFYLLATADNDTIYTSHDTLHISCPTCDFSYTSVSTNTEIEFTSIVGTGKSVYWDFGDGTSIDSGGVVVHQYAQGGYYTVCARIDSAGQYYARMCKKIYTKDYCEVRYIAQNDTLNVRFFDVSILSPPNVPQPVFSYFTDFGDGFTSTDRYPVHLYALPGKYNICHTISSPLCTSSRCDSIDVQHQFSYYPYWCHSEFAFTENSTGQFEAINFSTNDTCTWDFGDGSAVSHDRYPVHQYTSPGTYNLCLTITNGAKNCTDSYCKSLVIDSLGNLVYRGQSGYWLTVTNPDAYFTTSVPQLSDAAIKVYPNPTSSGILISSPNLLQLTVEVFSIEGRSVSKRTPVQNGTTIDLSYLSPNVYILRFTSQDGQVSYTRIVKQ